jgi:putative ABC transport system ATP-binding protein
VAADATRPGAPVLELRGVRKRFALGAREIEVLRGIDLRIDAGEFVSIMGPSGSGKTTLLELCGALSRPSEGEVRFEGAPIQQLEDHQLADLRARRLGFVFQSFHLLPRMSALRNAALPLVYAGVRRAEREARASALLERFGLRDRLEHRPAELSGGERQRVAIARALVNEPAVILADEPTGNLDGKTGREILDVFTRLHGEGRTLIVVTHDDAVAARAGRVVRLRDGLIEREAAVA